MYNRKMIGLRCKLYREKIGAYQLQVANETGYSPSTVSSFETGRDNNAAILLWYIYHGMTVDHLRGLK